MSQTFPPPSLRIVGSDVNTACSSAPVPEEEPYGKGGGAQIHDSTNESLRL